MKDRLKQIIEYYGIKARPFEIKISVSEGTISKFLAGKIGIKAETLQKINAIFPDINLDWLITGRGSMFYTISNATRADIPTPAKQPNIEALQVAADERERTIKVLQDTNKNLLEEIQQLRAYVNTTSSKYIQIVEQTLEAAKQTNGTVKQLQAQIGFHHAELHGRIAAHHKDKNH